MMTEEVQIEKLVHGGQGLGSLPDGRRVFVWNALPGERVLVNIKKSKSKHAEAVAIKIIEPSPDRIEPKDEAYLSTSPWQIMTFGAENQYKAEILSETLQREHVRYNQPISMVTAGDEWQYRNKMEYSFWGDDDGLHLALFHRASHAKRIVHGSSIARPEIDDVANKICQVLGKNNIRAGQLKTVIVRCDQLGNTVAALFVKDEKFPKIDFSNIAQGVIVYFSNPKSPASLATKKLYRYGELELTDTILDKNIRYDVNSFFQVNLPIFERAAQAISEATKNIVPKIDFYSGVGTIGLPVGATKLVEIEAHNADLANHNAGGAKVEIVQASAEQALDHIPSGGALIVDPPRAGLHNKVTERILEVKPEVIAYLSCNPITQARDLAFLQNEYEIKSIEGYNFFPRTPHIESLAVMIRR